MRQFTYWLYLLKIISLILIPLLFVGIIYLTKKLNIVSKKFEGIRNWFGINPFLSSSSKSRRQWKEIEDLLEEPYQSSWKLAVIKSDALVENFLRKLGYQGKNFEELLETLKSRGYQNLEILQGTHQVCKEILSNKDYGLSQKEAENIVAIYKRFWNELVENIL
ncbi:MAG: hypothetical protein WC306_00220 [Candidatus Paceibacterota bacterium]|jgi:hypothetical protein